MAMDLQGCHDAATLGQACRKAYLRALGIDVDATPPWWDRATIHPCDWERHLVQAGMAVDTVPPAWLILSRHIPLGRVYVWHSAMPPSSSFTTWTHAGGL
jgi:hypothetical protein